MKNFRKYSLAFSVLFSSAIILSAVQLNIERPMILLERFISGGGWVEIIIISFYGAFLAYTMQDQKKQAVWRLRSWTIFSAVFFAQLFLGLMGFEDFLMTGKLHLPIPMMIVAGPVYRLELSFMPILFLSTVLLSGPAWCSQLCYFGAIDGLMSKKKGRGIKITIRRLGELKLYGLTFIIFTAVLLRMLNVPVLYTTLLAGLFGIIGLLLIIVFSGRTGRMINCISWCPVGTLVNYLKYVNPFRFRIGDSCTSCMKCVPVCRYAALSPKNIKNRKPGITCTLCGDCINVCKPASFYYSFPGLGPSASRNLYLGITIVLHTVFLALARI